MSGRSHIAVEGGSARKRISHIPVPFGLIPKGTGIFDALGLQVEGGDWWTVAVYHAVIQERRISSRIVGKRRIAAGVCGRWPQQRTTTGRRIELRQAVERLVSIAVCCPILPHGAEIVFKSAVLLRHEDDVVHTLQAAGIRSGIRSG